MVVLICKDNMEGIYSGIYQAYEMHCDPADTRLMIDGEYEPEFFMEYREIVPDRAKAVKVRRTLIREFGEENSRKLSFALLSNRPDRADAVYHTVVSGLKNRLGVHVLENLSDSFVMRVMELWRSTGNEFVHMRGFLRFRELENGVLYARMKPEHNVMQLLMEHFCDRLPGENFIIHDTGRKSMAVHPAFDIWYYAKPPEKKEWDIIMQYSEKEFIYSSWFRTFCKSIAIRERKNISLQTRMLPLRFRPEMTEFMQDNSFPDASDEIVLTSSYNRG